MIMKLQFSSFTEIWQLIVQPTPEQRKSDIEGRPFFLLITFLLSVISLLVVFERLILGSPIRLAAYTGLLAVHIALHWVSGRIVDVPRWRLAYMILQGVSGFGVIWLGESPELVLAVFSALIGETIGLFGIKRQVWGAIIGYLLLLIAGYYVVGGIDTLTGWSSPTISTVLILIIFMVLYRRQLEARERTQELLDELESAHHQLASYAAQVKDLTLTTERQRMARELHDTLAQGLSGLVMQLEAIRHHVGKMNTDRVETIVRQALVSARTTLADSRAAINDLRNAPAYLSEDVRIKVERFTQATGIPCDLDLALGDADAISLEIGEHAQRILSEALANITQHAQATRVWVRFMLDDEKLELEVRDNGKGFKPENIVLAGHYGVLGMRERARLMNGVLVIESQVGQGTHINLIIPLNTEGLL